MMDIWYGLLKLIFRIFTLVCVRKVRVIGRENLIPGPKILVANHPNVTDSCVLPFILPERLYFLVQANMLDLPVIGFILRKSGQIPVVKGQGKDALNMAIKRLNAGETIVIFPEGKLNHGKSLHRAGSGAAVLAKKSGAPIVPIGFYVPPKDTMILKGRIQNRKTFGCWQVKGCCYLYVGEPWTVTKGNEDIVASPKLREITNRIMTQIAEQIQFAKSEAESFPGELEIGIQIPQIIQ